MAMTTRTPKETDFKVVVDGVGSFMFGRRKMSDEINIQREYARILDGVEPTQWLAIVAGWLSVFKIMMVSAPHDWDVEEFDPLGNDDYQKMKSVYDAFREKEDSFRRGVIPVIEGTST